MPFLVSKEAEAQVFSGEGAGSELDFETEPTCSFEPPAPDLPVTHGGSVESQAQMIRLAGIEFQRGLEPFEDKMPVTNFGVQQNAGNRSNPDFIGFDKEPMEQAGLCRLGIPGDLPDPGNSRTQA